MVVVAPAIVVVLYIYIYGTGGVVVFAGSSVLVGVIYDGSILGFNQSIHGSTTLTTISDCWFC